jgi:hypothetical protein
MWKRYLVTNSVFTALVVRAFVRRRLRPPRSGSGS